MANFLVAGLLMWQGLFVGVEHTANWRTPFKQPGITASATALVSAGKFNLRAVYLQPLQKDGFGPAVQVGVNVRLF